MARQKHVFPTGEIAHLWAHQTQDDARNPQGNLYFRGATLYSYRDSYPIAKIFKKKAATLVLHVENTYSNTTAGHCSDARRATSHLPSIVVPDVVPDSAYSRGGHAQNIKFLVDKAAEHLSKAQRALQVSTVSWRRNVARGALEDAEAYSKFFGIRRKVPAFPELAWNAAIARAERIENPDPVQDAKRFRAREQRAKVAGEVGEYREEMARSMTAAGHCVGYRALIGKRWPAAIARLTGKTARPFYHAMAQRTDWRLGLGYPADGPVMLRVNGEEIETSQGARIPLDHAPRVWRLVQAVISSGRPYVRNGRTEHAGPYPIDRVDVDGTVKAGCHTIPHSELRSMARQLGLAS